MDVSETTLAVGLGRIGLHCRRVGQGPPVLLIHGLLGSAFSWRDQMIPLAAAGFTAVAPDLPGFGESDRHRAGDYSHPSQAAALAELPGATAMLRRLLHRRWADAARFRQDLERFYGRPVPADVADDYWRRYRRPADREALVTQLRQSPWPKLAPHLGQVQVPTLLVWGERDKPVPLAHAHRLVAALTAVPGGAKLTVLPGVDHFVQESAPALFNQVLLDFIAKA